MGLISIWTPAASIGEVAALEAMARGLEGNSAQAEGFRVELIIDIL